MLDNILNGLKDQVVGAVTQQAGIDASKAEQAVPLAGDSIKEGLMGAAKNGQFGEITDMFKMFGGNSASGGGIAGIAQNAVYSNIATNFIGKLTSSLGLGEGVAKKVVGVALPLIMSKLGNKATTDSGDGLDMAGIASMLGGGGGDLGNVLSGLTGNSKDAGGSLADKAKGLLGGMFGK